MADISKCLGTGCDKKESCYRFTAPSNPYWQSVTPYYKQLEEGGECDSFWDNSGRKNTRRVDKT
jgi:hypothetical protein